MNYDWDWTFLYPYRWALLQGIWVTIQISLLSSFVGTLSGFILGATYRALPFRPFVLFLNDIFRAIPLLVLLFFFYFAPVKELFGVEPFSPFWATILAMSLSQAVFTADLVFHAVDRVNPKTVESAESLGLRKLTLWRVVIIPDIVRQTLPAMIAFWIGIVKLSSLASVVGCHDVVYVASAAGAQRYRSLEVWGLAMVVYIILVVPLTIAARRIEATPWIQRR